MTCPVDGTELKMSERQGVEIDYCPQCRGVWLDRGELDKIIDRSEKPMEELRGYEQPRGREYFGDYDDDDRHYKGKRRRRGWLGEMFEFGD
ncbi:MAG: zf-TFIIB domain-containing protein [Actinomycetota bacterium]|nr:zf-TFIIB domain-containing protein [Actinomycetota bacterium]